jgi:hypothetical protein
MRKIQPGSFADIAKDFFLLNKEVIVNLRGKILLEQMIELSQIMQDSAMQNGFSEDSCQALFLFISEVTNNALKARGSLEIVNRYGSFEALFLSESNPREIINKTVEKYYPDTEILIKWILSKESIILEISNNTELNDYFEKRINEAIHKNPEISEELIEMLSKDDNIFDTKASGIGMGLSMAVNFAAISGGVLTYNKNNPGWTTFKLILNLIK